ncbi:hypothetical protein [Bremerella sp.]|uniref:AbiJ-related protein n=1 Tax=Bremerella sp. TaxID=2795602 RepID=UPI00391A327E
MEVSMFPADRNRLQDIIWPVGHPIPKRHRREIAEAVSIHELFRDGRAFDELVESLFIVEEVSDGIEAIFGSSGPSLKDEIARHVHRNPGDWDVEYLFDRLGALSCTSTRFARFLEGLVGPDVMPDEPSQRQFVERMNPILAKCGLEFREVDERDGYPVFLLAETGSSTARPKNLIFASPVKPDLRFRDAVNNDIEIVTNADKVLVYDRPISTDGIRWCDLQEWWSELRAIENTEVAKNSLYARLRDSIPQSSPPQKRFFNAYHTAFRDRIPLLPALLPEVWLHWDPQTVRARGPKALVRSRMDFLMLLPAGVRVVLEVDGQHHYAESGRPSPTQYAAMVAADRQLKLDGYQVFRFGCAELVGEPGKIVVREFFKALFDRFNVSF